MAFSKRHPLNWTGTVESDSMLGDRQSFNVKDYATSQVAPPTQNSARCEAIFVLNKSGGTLAKGSLVLPSATASYEFPFAVAGVASTGYYCGAVSPFIAASTVANGAGFWLIVSGLTMLPYSGSGTILRGSFLETAATGRCTLRNTGVFCGIAHDPISSGDAGTLFWANLAPTC